MPIHKMIYFSFLYSLAKLNDTDGTEYILMRGTFKMNMDEWDLNMVQIPYSVPTIVVGDRAINSAG